MLVSQETIKKVRLFGLNTYEARVWIALLSRGTSTAGELSDIANVPRSRSYDVLESLEKKGFVVMKLGKPIKYFAVPPKDVLENIKKRVERNIVSYLTGIKSDSFNKLMKNLHNIHEKNKNDHSNFVALLKGRDNIYKHLTFILNNAKKEIIASFEELFPINLKLINPFKNKPGLSVKHLNLGIRVCIADEDNVLIFPIQREKVHPDYDLCMWINNRYIASFLKSQFRNCLAL